MIWKKNKSPNGGSFLDLIYIDVASSECLESTLSCVAPCWKLLQLRGVEGMASAANLHYTLPETNSNFAPENRRKASPKGKGWVFQPSNFRCYVSYVSFREGHINLIRASSWDPMLRSNFHFSPVVFPMSLIQASAQRRCSHILRGALTYHFGCPKVACCFWGKKATQKTQVVGMAGLGWVH